MDKQIRKLKKLVDKHLHQAKKQIAKEWKKPLKESVNEIWFFRKYRWFVVWDEVTFIFDEDKVIDIAVTEYLLGIELRNIYYFQYQIPEYKVVDSF